MASECQLAGTDGSTQSPDNTHSEFLCIMQLQSQLSQLDLILCATYQSHQAKPNLANVISYS